ncbi:MAG: polysaccharide deacetylase family protein [Solirubrobacteraceae bacterium]|nr:polysaccharide deacetylase family protein [Solirubrobacteraceae bacterium]
MSGGAAAARQRRMTILVGVLVVVAIALVLVTGPLKPGGGSSASSSAAVPATAGTDAPSKPAAANSAAPKPASGDYRGPVPILMYHVIKEPTASTPMAELWTPAETFKATIELLKKDGYNGVTLDQVWQAWNGGPGLPDKPLVISFDDGYLSHTVTARPILQAAGWPGVLNLEGKNIGKGGLTTTQVEGLIAAGWEIDSHTLTHPDLTASDDASLKTELVDSRKLLQEKFNVPANFFCYPAGKNDARVRAAVKAAGYKGATTVEPGVASKSDNPYELPRIRVNGTDSAATVAGRVRSGAGVSGGY